MSLVIPTLPDNSNYSIKCNLDGQDYGLDFNYSTREKCWYFNISNSENVLLLAGIKIVTLYPLCLYQKDFYKLPPGLFYAASGTIDNSTPMIGELGVNRRVQLVYYTEAELQV